MSLAEVAQAFGEWPVFTQFMVGSAAISSAVVACRAARHEYRVRRTARQLMIDAEANRVVQSIRSGKGSINIQSAGDSSVQIINTGGGTFNVQSGRAGSGIIVTGIGAAKAKAAMMGANKALRTINEYDATGNIRRVKTLPPPVPITIKHGDGKAEPQSLTEWRATDQMNTTPANGLLATTWCAGCDALVRVTDMGWTVDTKYRCRTCRGVDAVRECEADDEPSRHADAGAMTSLQNLLHDVAVNAYGVPDSVSGCVPIIVQTPTVDPWLHVDPNGTPLSQTDPPCPCATCRSGVSRETPRRIIDGKTGRTTHLISPAGSPIVFDPQAEPGQRFRAADVDPGSLVDQVLNTSMECDGRRGNHGHPDVVCAMCCESDER